MILKYLPDFLKAIENADLVIGSRYIPGGDTPNWTMLRRLISGGGKIFARFMLGFLCMIAPLATGYVLAPGFRKYRS